MFRSSGSGSKKERKGKKEDKSNNWTVQTFPRVKEMDKTGTGEFRYLWKCSVVDGEPVRTVEVLPFWFHIGTSKPIM